MVVDAHANGREERQPHAEVIAVRCDNDAELLELGAKGGNLRIPDHGPPVSAA